MDVGCAKDMGDIWHQDGRIGAHVFVYLWMHACFFCLSDWYVIIFSIYACVSCMCTPILRCPITPLTIGSAELSSLFHVPSCFWLLSWSPRRVERRPNSKVPYVHSLSLCRISQWVTQEVDALVFTALNRDLLWTLTSSEPRDKPCRHLGCHDKHKPGSAGRL